MEKKRLDDMLNILKLNNSVNTLYKHLCELELKGELDSPQYKEYKDMIRFASSRCDKYMLKYNLSDTDINEFISLIIELNRLNKYDPMNYIDPVSNIKFKRFIEHNYELSLLYHQSDEDMYNNEDGVIIEGVNYDYETGIAMLEEEGMDEMVEDIKFLQEQAKNEEAEERDRDDLNFAELALETHTFMKYLLDAINEETNKTIKKKLIEVKYRIIANIRSLELSFLYDSNLDYSLSIYQKDVHRTFKKRNVFYAEYIMRLEQIIDWARMQVIERSKEKYDNIDDKIYDILLTLLLKTYTSIIPNETVREGIMEDSDAGIELAKSKIDKKILKRSISLNSKYVLYDIKK